jgi:8-oxo-dGTP pyrophosphatase MutT (NUDIX family)
MINKITGKKITKNWSYTIPEGEHKGETLWSGRYVAVAGFVFRKVKDEWYVLAEKRGSGAADFRGEWCCPCGFVEASETCQQAIQREVLEETGLNVDENDFNFWAIHDDPETCNNGHVTLRYIAVQSDYSNLSKLEYKNINGEENEVSEIEWINVKYISLYKWAFNHDNLIPLAFNFAKQKDFENRGF